MIKIFKKKREVSIFSNQKEFKDQKSDFSGVVILQEVCPQNVSLFLHLECFLSLPEYAIHDRGVRDTRGARGGGLNPKITGPMCIRAFPSRFSNEPRQKGTLPITTFLKHSMIFPSGDQYNETQNAEYYILNSHANYTNRTEWLSCSGHCAHSFRIFFLVTHPVRSYLLTFYMS